MEGPEHAHRPRPAALAPSPRARDTCASAYATGRATSARPKGRPSAVRRTSLIHTPPHATNVRLHRWRSGSPLRALLLDAAVILTGIGAYFGTRGLTEGSRITAVNHAQDILRVERALGLDLERGAQSAVASLPAVTTFANWIYIWGHWPALAAAFLWLASKHRSVFRRLRDAMMLSGLAGLSVYTTYPVAPPRLAGLGLIDTVSEQSHAYRVLQPPAFVNQYAAMPSLHVGWDLLLGLALVAAASGWLLRTVGRVMPAAMAAATVLTANHYLVDVMAGASLGLLGWLAAGRLEARRQQRSVGLRPTTSSPQLPAATLDDHPGGQRPVSAGSSPDVMTPGRRQAGSLDYQSKTAPDDQQLPVIG